jgi:hypothetical protein
MAVAFLIRAENENFSRFCPTWPIFLTKEKQV